MDQGRESEHDLEYDKMPQPTNLVYDLGCAAAQVDVFTMKQSMRTELGQTREKQKLVEHTGFSWWSEKLRPGCLKCKALADGITHGEAKKNHMEMRNARDTKRANDWKETTEG